MAEQRPVELVFTDRDVIRLLNLIHNFSDKWYEIGLGLGFTPPELDQIRSNPSRFTSAPTSFLIYLLSQWVQWPTMSHPTRPTLGALCETLRSSFIGLGQLAEKVEKEFVTDSGVRKSKLNNSDILTSNVKSDQYARLHYESLEMGFKFQNLFSSTSSSLKQRNVTVEMLRDRVCCLGHMYATFEDSGQPQFRHTIPKLADAKTVEDAMFIVHHYCSFFNYHLLENIITGLGSEQDKLNMTKYKEDFTEYSSSHVLRYPSDHLNLSVGETSNEGDTIMVVTLDSSFDGCNLSSLYSFAENVRKILGIPTLKLCRISSGSLKLEFQLPHEIQHNDYDNVFPLSEKEKMELYSLHVVQITCENFEFNIEEIKGKQEFADYITGDTGNGKDHSASGLVSAEDAASCVDSASKSSTTTQATIYSDDKDTRSSVKDLDFDKEYSLRGSELPPNTATDGSAGAALIKKGRECIALAESVCSNITEKSIDGVEQMLKTLKKTAEVLAKDAEKKAKDIEEEQEKCMKKIEEIQREISQAAINEEQLKRSKSELESSLYAKRSTLDSMRQTLSSAESDLRSAENKLSKAKREEGLRVGGGAAFGAILGTILAPGLGTVIGAAAGVGLGGTLNVLIDEEKAARNRVDDCRRRCRNAESDVQSVQSQISNIQSQISSLTSQCANLKRQQEKYNADVKEMKEAVVFFQTFWKELQEAAKSADTNTELMQDIMSEKQDLKWLTCGGTQDLGKTFREAWVLIEIKCEEGNKFINSDVNYLATCE